MSGRSRVAMKTGWRSCVAAACVMAACSAGAVGDTVAPAAPVKRWVVTPTALVSAGNTHRLAFGTNNLATIMIDQPVAAARIVVRDQPLPSRLRLDGKPVRADQPCNTLRPGLNELYRQTAPFRLESGKHVLAVETGGSDTNCLFSGRLGSGRFRGREARDQSPAEGGSHRRDVERWPR
jgi:hypothetical protein